tara:strand:- start:6 stop:134 length:129 start_codon:yes stop_codon:yes gene_type:complete
MKITYKPNEVINAMLLSIARKKRLKPERMIDELIEQAYKIYG